MAKATERTTWDTLPGRPDDLVTDAALLAALVPYVKMRPDPAATLDDNSRIERIDYSDGAYKELTWTDDRLTRRDLVVGSVTYRRDITYDANGIFSSATDSVIS